MSGKTFKSTITSSMDVVTTAPTSSGALHPKQRIVQNFLLIWVDASINESKQNCQHTLAQLRSVVNDIRIFVQWDEAIDFLTDVHDMKVFLLLGDTFGQQIVPLIHNIPQLDGIYIFCETPSGHEQCTKKWINMKAMHTDIKLICEALQLAAKQY